MVLAKPTRLIFSVGLIFCKIVKSCCCGSGLGNGHFFLLRHQRDPENPKSAILIQNLHPVIWFCTNGSTVKQFSIIAISFQFVCLLVQILKIFY
jgi:hypothetical protein